MQAFFKGPVDSYGFLAKWMHLCAFLRAILPPPPPPCFELAKLDLEQEDPDSKSGLTTTMTGGLCEVAGQAGLFSTLESGPVTEILGRGRLTVLGWGLAPRTGKL